LVVAIGLEKAGTIAAAAVYEKSISRGAPPPPHTTIEFKAGPVSPKPEDVCFEVTKTIKEENGVITETWRIRMYAC
jgi:hypothetical protein